MPASAKYVMQDAITENAENDNTRPIATLVQGDCLELLKELPDASIDLAVLDLPYGTTRMAWDAVIPWQPLWTELRRVLTDTGTVVAFGSQPFTTDLIQSARDLFKYSAVWEKNGVTNFTNANVRFLKSHEDIAIFSKGSGCSRRSTRNRMTYNPQNLVPAGTKTYRAGRERINFMELTHANKRAGESYEAQTNYPRSVLKFAKDAKHDHPTQKPVALLRYLIETFSNPGDVVLDPTMGSGSTCVAALQCGRHAVGFEADPEFFAIAEERVNLV